VSDCGRVLRFGIATAYDALHGGSPAGAGTAAVHAGAGDRCLESPVMPRTSVPHANHFDCAAGRVAYLSPLGLIMFEAIAAFFVILSVGILVAHALDAFRSLK
jgi:hypothetical protein